MPGPRSRPSPGQPVDCDYRSNVQSSEVSGRLTPTAIASVVRQPTVAKGYHRRKKGGTHRASIAWHSGCLPTAEDLQIGTTTPTNKERHVVPICLWGEIKIKIDQER
jgi:hypothetical protein